MAEEFHLEILVISLLMVLSFLAAHLLRKFNIIWLPESLVAGACEGQNGISGQSCGLSCCIECDMALTLEHSLSEYAHGAYMVQNAWIIIWIEFQQRNILLGSFAVYHL